MSVAQARRVAIAAQGLAAARPARVGLKQVLGVVERVGVVQIDSVNVLCRAHYMPFFSRLGPYDRAVLDGAMGGAAGNAMGGTASGSAGGAAGNAMGGQPQRLFEYWAHEAGMVLPETHRMLRWRMARWRNGHSSRDRWAADHPEVLEAVTTLVKDHGPLTVGQMRAMSEEQPQARTKRVWWGNWPPEKMAAELLFGRGTLTSAGRTQQFERRFVLPEQVLPPQIVAAEDPTEALACTELVRIAARAMGVATDRDLRDYFRLGRAEATAGIETLAEAGELVPVAVEGIRRPAWLHRDARIPRSVKARALLAPFDPLIWERSRLEELFGVHYRIEIYVPQPQRQFGYYVLPFLLGDRIVARVDLKADRMAGVLRVPACYAEDGHGASDEVVAGELAAELRLMAGWLGLDGIEVADRGDLAPALRSAVVAHASASASAYA